jgi:hydrogenase-4 component F
VLLVALVLVPVAAALLAFSTPAPVRRALLPVTACAHGGLVVACAWARPPSVWDGALALDALGVIFLGITSVLFAAVSFYTVGYLRREPNGGHAAMTSTTLRLRNTPEAVFVGCMLLFLAAMTFVTLAQNFGHLWVGIESTTLASAPLIYYHRSKRSLEATWKYLLLCSVGIALALLGNFAFVLAARDASDGSTHLVLSELVARNGGLHHGWLEIGFVFFVVGYGTKMGLAPMHSWLPDAHSEAPSAVSALLSGALLNCAFLGILRALQVLDAAGVDSGRDVLLVLGLASLVVAAVFLVRQGDYKRLLAYSSVEHMGLLALAASLGPAGLGVGLLHAMNHSLTKAALFMVAGNVLARTHTKRIADVRGILRDLPQSGLLWLLGIFAILGVPPFGVFASKLAILQIAFAGAPWVGVVVLALLAIVFVGMTANALPMALGRGGAPSGLREPAWSVLPPAMLLAATLALGLWIPGDVLAHIRAALAGWKG